MLKEYLNGIEMYCFQWNYIDSNMYVLIENERMLIIDPVITEEVVCFFTKQKVDEIWIVLTHEHFDHINGVNWLKEHFVCKVFANMVCAEAIQSESKNLSDKSDVILMFNSDIRNRNISILPFRCSADIIFDNSSDFNWQNHFIELITTPGHTDGSICIVLDQMYIFTGDTLLDVPTITRLPSGSKKKFEQITLPILKNFKTIEKVYPGHGKFGKLDKMLLKYNQEI